MKHFGSEMFLTAWGGCPRALLRASFAGHQGRALGIALAPACARAMSPQCSSQALALVEKAHGVRGRGDPTHRACDSLIPVCRTQRGEAATPACRDLFSCLALINNEMIGSSAIDVNLNLIMVARQSANGDEEFPETRKAPD
jgi:hypothetical protein